MTFEIKLVLSQEESDLWESEELFRMAIRDEIAHQPVGKRLTIVSQSGSVLETIDR